MFVVIKQRLSFFRSDLYQFNPISFCDGVKIILFQLLKSLQSNSGSRRLLALSSVMQSFLSNLGAIASFNSYGALPGEAAVASTTSQIQMQSQVLSVASLSSTTIQHTVNTGITVSFGSASITGRSLSTVIVTLLQSPDLFTDSSSSLLTAGMAPS